MSSTIQSQFDQILLAAKERRGDLSVDSMIVSSHLAQMRTFIIRRGVEFYADQDSFAGRRPFIEKVCEENMLEMRLESIVDYFMCDGQGLFYFRPNGDSYQIMYFPKESYRAYRDQEDKLESVVLRYSFRVRESNTIDPMMVADGRGGKKKWIQLKVYKDRVEQTISNEKIEFDNENNIGMAPTGMQGQTTTYENSLNFIPAVEIFNYMDCTGEHTGNGEFDWLANHIMYHDELVKNIRKNLKFFGNPTLVSSRPKHDIVDSEDESSFKPTISSQAGFAPLGGGRHSTRVSQPFGASVDGSIKVPRVIANLEPTDRVQYMTPDSVSGDQNMYVKQYRQEIRLALGGVDDLDISTAQTAYEIKTLYGRVAATAEKKAKALFTYGLCKLFAMMISNEEKLFEESLCSVLGLVRPNPPLIEDFEDQEEEVFLKQQEKYEKALEKFVKQKDNSIAAILETGQIPLGVTGLIPDGSTKVSWRWTGQVFEDSPDDVLQHSIVVRNLQELGVDSIEALKFLFPGKTDDERAAMLSGYPFRMVQQTQQSINSFIGLLGSLYQLPHPQAPNMPLGADPNLDLTGFLYRSLEFLRKELSYSGKYQPTSSGDSPDKLSAGDAIRAKLGRPVRDERPVTIPGIGDNSAGSGDAAGSGSGPGPAGFGAPGSGAGESMAAGVPGSFRKPEYTQPIPNPGSILGVSDTNTTGSAYTSQLQFTPGSPDLQSPSFNPGLFSGAGAGAGKPSGKRGRKSSK